MKLIADSGSTKTHWVLLKDNQSVAEIRSQGINPFFQNEERIRQVVKMEVAYPLRSQGVDLEQVNELFFYGAGLREEMKGKVTQIQLWSLRWFAYRGECPAVGLHTRRRRQRRGIGKTVRRRIAQRADG